MHGTTVGAPGLGPAGDGRRAAAATVQTAQEHGADRMTLITYAEVPWDAPCYARHVWRPVTQLTPGLRALREHETALGLDRHDVRTVMSRSVSRGLRAGTGRT